MPGKDHEHWSVDFGRSIYDGFRDSRDEYLVNGEHVIYEHAFSREPRYFVQEGIEAYIFDPSAYEEFQDRAYLKFTRKFPFLRKEIKKVALLKNGWHKTKKRYKVTVRLPKETYALIDNRTEKAE